MSDLLVLIYEDEHRAAHVSNALRRENPGLTDLQHAAHVERDFEGVSRLHQGSWLTERGPVAGAWTPLIGPLLASVDTAGASATLVDYGIDDAFAQQVATELAPGRSALFALLTNDNAAEVRCATASYGGRVLNVTLLPAAATRLGRGLRARSGHRQSA
jgi:uncharacterized membrane protein